MIMWVMSDRAIPRSFRFMEGFGVHTFRFLNAKDESTFVKFHWKPKLGLQSVVWNEAVKINGADPDFHRRDLWNAIQSGNFPEWELRVQLFDQEFADNFDFDVLDPTKIIPEEILEPIPVGRLVLDRMPDNFFAETEQVAFMTQNVPPGIDFSNDPLLQGRNFSYLDTQLKRLGSPNFTHIPINAPKCPFAHFQQDGHMAMRNPVGRVNYQPNSFGEGPRESPQRGFRSFAGTEEGPKVRLRAESFADHYSQARQFFNSQTAPEQRHIAMALTFELSKVETPAIRERMVSHLLNIDEGLPRPSPTSSAWRACQSLQTPRSRRGTTWNHRPLSASSRTDRTALPAAKWASLSAPAPTPLYSRSCSRRSKRKALRWRSSRPRSAASKPRMEAWIEAKHMIDGGPSVLFDAVALILSEEGAERLTGEAAARDFVADAFAHCKFIGFTAGAVPLLQKAGVDPEADEGLIDLDDAKAIAGFVQSLPQAPSLEP